MADAQLGGVFALVDTDPEKNTSLGGVFALVDADPEKSTSLGGVFALVDLVELKGATRAMMHYKRLRTQ